MKKILFVLLAVIMMVGCFAVCGNAVLYVPITSEGGSELVHFMSSYDAIKYTSAYVCTKKVIKGEDGYSSTVTYTYDSKGNLIKRAGEDLVDITCTYAYDSKGNLIKKNEKLFGLVFTYKYNSKGNLIKEVCSCDGDKSVNTYSYDSNGNCNDDVWSYYEDETCTYDRNGNLIKTVEKTDDGYTYTYVYTYDSKGNLVKEIFKNFCSSYYYTTTTKYTYNSNGCLIKKTEKDYDGTQTSTYTYKKITTKSPVIAGRIHIQYATASYTGNARKPNVTVDDLRKGVDYKVTYSNNVNIGTAKAKITFLGDNATQEPVTIKYRIVPGKVKVTSAAMKSGTYNVSVKWNKVAGAEGYEIYYYNNTDKKYEKLLTTAVTSYSKTWPGWNTVKLKIRAVCGSTKGPWSDVVTLVHLDKVKVTSATMKSGTYNVSVKWNKVTGAKSYEVYAYNFDEKIYVKVCSTSKTSYSQTWTDWQTVKLKIRAVNGSTNGAWSDVVTLKHKA